MPTFSRSGLRQRLTTNYVRDGLVSTLTATGNAASSLPQFVDNTQADPSLSGQNLYQRAWIKHRGMELRVASFNAASGAYISAMLAATLVLSGGTYEVSNLMSQADKDRAIDSVISRTKVIHEVGLPTVDGNHLYTIDGAASPHLIQQVLDCYYFQNPTGSLSRGLSRLDTWDIVSTPTGAELRIDPCLAQSQQLVMLAVLSLTLGAADTATINLPDERWILSGAAAQVYDLLIRKTPGQSRGQYEKDRKEFAATYTRLSQSFAPAITRTMQGLINDADSWNNTGGWDQEGF